MEGVYNDMLFYMYMRTYTYTIYRYIYIYVGDMEGLYGA